MSAPQEPADPRENQRINRHLERDLEFWTAHFGVTRERLLAAIDAVGPLVKNVREALGV